MGEPTWMYHPEHGAQMFDSDDLELLDSGWVDTPAKIPGEDGKLKPFV
jgi:hypothetical protein